jgi:hypothetical protein
MNDTTGHLDIPAFDDAALLRLVDEVEDASFVSFFATCYRDMLESRVARIVRALMSADVDEALDATLSLKVASTTVGTRELAGLALVIEGDVRRHDVASARLTAARLSSAAARADQALAAYLSARESA